MGKVLLADDHDLVRETIAAYLRQTGLHEVHPVEGLNAAQDALRAESFDLVLLDYRMPGMEAFDGLRLIRRAFPDVPVALISGAASPEVARQAMGFGASGFLPKTLAPDELIRAVDRLVAGGTFLPDEAVARMSFSLTPREVEVVRGIAAGYSNKEIARELGVQEVTVKLHVKTLSRKLEARNRTHAAMRARDLGLV
ncbi:DNA-binding response regulator, LuxR family protein [Pseudooceanicola batsensis HTCC2597]|uniref:DNA-binding response regulator, LuxR family protein n=1 Tax=Pseudooceanicola batsensis (strain ATCC BAA-863 / DSM 15984 / KCTC 12145 / HTCC2597) TaxID=252305 RepID=A3U430_PSEBH|nr:response regulator transcription factor [Pseudooceanicola batsensis]EAQ01077.1 DNA-binding response regulator, LuxR family protein [Pseudooceanicola batsensis HTCC2597]